MDNESNYSLPMSTEVSKAEEPGGALDASDLATYTYYFSAGPWLGWLAFLAVLSVGVATKVFQCKHPVCLTFEMEWFTKSPLLIAATWVKWWAHDNDVEPNRNINMRVAVDCSLAVIYAAMFLISQWYAMCADSNVTEFHT